MARATCNRVVQLLLFLLLRMSIPRQRFINQCGRLGAVCVASRQERPLTVRLLTRLPKPDMRPSPHPTFSLPFYLGLFRVTRDAQRSQVRLRPPFSRPRAATARLGASGFAVRGPCRLLSWDGASPHSPWHSGTLPGCAGARPLTAMTKGKKVTCQGLARNSPYWHATRPPRLTQTPDNRCHFPKGRSFCLDLDTEDGIKYAAGQFPLG
jgi:hypothetical protein